MDPQIQPGDLLKELFQAFHLIDFYNGLEQWLRMAIATEQSAYDEGYKRKDLMDLVDYLKKLVHCWHSEHL